MFTEEWMDKEKYVSVLYFRGCKFALFYKIFILFNIKYFHFI